TRVCRSVHVLPPQQRQIATQGVWLTSESAQDPDPAYVAWHTLVHAVLAGLPLLLLGAASDLRAGVYEGATGWEAVFSDAHAGGNGTSACLYEAHERMLRVALQVLLDCDCAHGCSRCVATPRCGTCGGDGRLRRQAGMQLLQRLLGGTVPTFASVAAGAAHQPAHARAGVPTGTVGTHERPRHLYLALSTQKSAEEVGGWQHKHLLGLGVAVTYDTQEGGYPPYTAEARAALLPTLRAA